MPISGGKYQPGNMYQPGQYQHMIAPNLPVGSNKAQPLPSTQAPKDRSAAVLKGGSEYAIVDPKDRNAVASLPAKKAPRAIPPGSEKTWPGGGTEKLIDRLCGTTRANLGISGSNKLS